MERRAHVRQPVEVPAEVDTGGARVPGTIRDFCIGGVFFQLDGGDPPASLGDPVHVEFGATVAGRAGDYEVPAKVAAIFGGGMGLEFLEPDPGALQALQDVAGRARETSAARHGDEAGSARSGQGVDGPRVIGACRQRLTRFIEGSVEEVFKGVEQALFLRARDAKNNAEQTEIFDVMSEATKVRKPIEKAFSSGLIDQIDNLGAPKKKQQSERDDDPFGELSLVDTQSFSDWLAVKKIIEKAEPLHKEQMFFLEARLSVLANSRITEQNNPISPVGFCSAFHDAMQNLGISKIAREAILAAFDKHLMGELAGFYETLDALFREHGVLPDLELPKPEAPRIKRAPQRPDPAAKPPTHDEGEDPWAGAAAEPPAAPGHAPRPAAPAPAGPDWRSYHQGAAGAGTAGQAPAPGAPAHHGAAASAAPATMAPAAGFAPAPAGPAAAGAPESAHIPAPTTSPAPAPPAGIAPSAYRAARSLLGLHREVAQRQSAPGAAAVAAGNRGDVPAVDGSTYQPQQVLDALRALQHQDGQRALEATGHFDLRERLMAALAHEHGNGQGQQLGATEGDAVEVIANLFDSVLQDPLVEDPVKARIRRLAVPMLRVAMRDEGFFADQAHPARQVVNQLGQIDLPLDAQSGPSLRSTVDPLVERIVREYDQDLGVFREVQDQLDALVSSQAQRYAANVEKVIQQAEDKQRLVSVRRGPAEGQAVAQRQVPAEWQRWLNRAKRLEVGDSLALEDASGERRRVQLAWLGQDGNDFMFVDTHGERAASLSLNELAMALRRGTAQVVEASDLPVVDRGLYAVLRDLHERLVREATHDPLTGLLNRREFDERLERVLTEALREKSTHVLCYLDLDNFGDIAEACGEKAGNKLLSQLARVLERHVGEGGFLCRVQESEFAMVLERCTTEQGLDVAERQRHAIDQSRCIFKGRTFDISVSVGVVTVDAHSESPEAVVAAAREASTAARAAGGNRVEVYSPKPSDPVAPREETEEDIATWTARIDALLTNDDLVLRCQRVAPVIPDPNAKPHYEILIGVPDGAGAFGTPGGFILEAERRHRMPDVDRWVIRQVFAWIKDNRKRMRDIGGFAINLSGHTLSDDALIEFVLDQFSKTKIAPAKVMFEVTETVAIASLSTATDFIRVLKEYGCRFLLDDFGSGHASYSYLKRLPVDFVKIDGMFVKDICNSDSDLAMVKSINEIGHFMGKLTVAEYVENDEILAQLKEIGVDYAQGFGIEKPVLLSELR